MNTVIIAWKLFVCAGISWGGCGHSNEIIYPNEESCYKALRNILIVDQPIAENKNKRSMYAVCSPVYKDK